jgi:hypothetical protein
MAKVTGVFKATVDPAPVDPLTLDPAGSDPTGFELPHGQVGKSYHEVIKISGGKSPYKLAVSPVPGLPPGVTATVEGNSVVLSGIPTTAGSGVFDIEVDDSQA